MIKASNAERIELYKDRNTQILLNKFLSGEMSELEPVYDPKRGYWYPVVDEIVGDDAEASVFIKRLYDAGILERQLYDKIIYCPKCGSANVSVHYCCPYCKSFNILKSSLIEHVKCGYMDVEENFRKEEKFVCPKCNEELKKSDVDYRQAGIWCKCKECRKSFDIPETEHFCRVCKSASAFEDAVIKEVYVYNLREEIKQEASVGWVIIGPIRGFLQENGFNVESPAFLKGKSGANHMFDIAAYKGERIRKVTVIDFASSAENVVLEQPVIALFAKIFDVSPDAAYLVAIPKMSENGKRMAELYDIQIVESKDQEETLRQLKEKLLENE